MKSGALLREKVEGVWLFAVSEQALVEGSEQVRVAAITVCSSWLIAPMPPLVGTVARELAGAGISRDAVQAYLRSQLRRRGLRAIPLLNQAYQPYFAVFSPDDQPEVDRQLAVIRGLVDENGGVFAADLPEPYLPRRFRAWRSNLLQHAEYLGLGRLVKGSLVGWRQ